jgi:hypothetical protein
MGKCDVRWGYFFEFLELFLHGEMWGDMLLEFSKIFSIEKGGVAWGDFLVFLELFLIEKDGVAWVDVTCYLNFHKKIQWRKVMWHEVMFLNFENYFSMEEDDVTCFLNF